MWKGTNTAKTSQSVSPVLTDRNKQPWTLKVVTNLEVGVYNNTLILVNVICL